MILNKKKCQPYFVNEKWSSQLKIDSILWTLRKRDRGIDGERERAKNRERDRDKKVKKGINQRKAKKMNENECKRNFYKIF